MLGERWALFDLKGEAIVAELDSNPDNRGSLHNFAIKEHTGPPGRTFAAQFLWAPPDYGHFSFSSKRPQMLRIYQTNIDESEAQALQPNWFLEVGVPSLLDGFWPVPLVLCLCRPPVLLPVVEQEAFRTVHVSRELPAGV